MKWQKYQQSGEMRTLAVYAPERVKGMEDIPTAKEQGIDFVQAVSYWFFAPPGTSADIVEYLADILEKVMQDPAIRSKMEEMIMVPSYKRGD